MEKILSIISSNGIEAIIAALFVLLAVYAFNRVGVIVSGEQKRLANVILSILIVGVDLLNAPIDDVFVAAFASIVSALIYNALHEWQKNNALK